MRRWTILSVFRPTLGVALGVALAPALGCGEQRTAETPNITTGPGTTGPDDGTAHEDVLDVGAGPHETAGADGDDRGCLPVDVPTPNATLTGKVLAPNLEIPISGALVYVGNHPAEPVPDQTYCSECVDLPCDVTFTITEPDGTFELPAVAGPGQHVVVQKGQFVRDVVVDIDEGTQTLLLDQTNLPGRWAPDEGMWIPRIAVYQADPDRVYNVLAKFGLGEVSANGDLVMGTEQFDLIDPSDQGAFMDDLAQMRNYHIIFLPCAATKFWVGAPTVSPLRVQNIRDYVAGGGKWYATDHSNEYVAVPFPQYQDFHAPAMPDLQPAYDVNGVVDDPELLAWLEALPPNLADIGGGNANLASLPSVNLRQNFSGIDSVHEVIVQDDDGNEVDVGPHTWVSGPCTSCSDPATFRPMAFTSHWGCGRVMYSTFETSSFAHAGLNPQELMLLYMILEIGVCFDEPPLPVPPVG